MLEYLSSLDKTIIILCVLPIAIFISTLFFANTNLNKLKKFNFFANFALLLLSIFLIFNNNLGQCAILIFLFFAINFFIKSNFSNSKQTQKTALLSFIFDITCYLTIVFLFLSGFIRYFLLNDIPLEIAQLGNYLYEIDKISLNCAFFGIIIILSRFFGFVPFNFSTNALSDKLPPLILFQQRLYSTSIALILFLKFYPVFQDLFLEYETFLTGYLILNLVWYILILFKTQNAFKIVANSLALHFSYALIVIFSPSELSADFIYFAFILILSYLLISLILTVLCNHFKTRSITDFKTIGDKTRIVQIYTILSFLNIAKVAPFGLFVPNIILCVNLFSIPFEDINTIIPYLMVFALLIYAIFIINIICKLNINIQNDAIDFQFKKSEFLILTLLIFTIIGFCLCPQYFFNEFLISIESF